MTIYLRALTRDQINLAEVSLVTRRERATDVAGVEACNETIRALSRAADGERIAMPIVCDGWNKRASAVDLPKKGAKREADREAYMQGAITAMVALGVMTVERANQIGFLCAVSRLETYMQQEASKDRPADEPTLDPKKDRIRTE